MAEDGAAPRSHALYVSFLPKAPAKERIERLLAFRTDVDDFHVHGREAYWLCRIKMSESKFSGNALEKALGMPATMRNITTVRKLADNSRRRPGRADLQRTSARVRRSKKPADCSPLAAATITPFSSTNTVDGTWFTYSGVSVSCFEIPTVMLSP